jgi:hypothetical protein
MGEFWTYHLDKKSDNITLRHVRLISLRIKLRIQRIIVSRITSKCTTCNHFKVHHFGWVFSAGLRGWLAR